MIDRTTKIFLGLIALGLWANVATSFLNPLTAVAQGRATVNDLAADVDAIKGFVQTMASGECLNKKICSP